MLNNPYNKRTDRNRSTVSLIFLIIIAIFVFSIGLTVNATDGATTSADSTDTIILSLDERELNSLLDGLSDRQKNIFGGSDFISTLKKVVSGDLKLDYSNIFSFLLSLVGTSLSDLIWLILTIIAVAITYSIIGSIKGKKDAKTIDGIIHFAATAVVLTIVGSLTLTMFDTCRKMFDSLSLQINTVLPILLTLMAATGATSTATVYQPTVAVLAGGVFNLISVAIFPLLIAAFAFCIVGNISPEVKLDKMSAFFQSVVKWLFGTAFFLLSAFMSVQGITASVFDGITVRTAKLSLSRHIPIIGSYMSEGLNLIISGGILVKNSVGYVSVVLLLITVLPIIIQLAVYSLALKLSSAAIEPLGDELLSKLLFKISKIVSLTASIMIGAAFLYFIFIVLVISTGNISL